MTPCHYRLLKNNLKPWGGTWPKTSGKTMVDQPVGVGSRAAEGLATVARMFCVMGHESRRRMSQSARSASYRFVSFFARARFLLAVCKRVVLCDGEIPSTSSVARRGSVPARGWGSAAAAVSAAPPAASGQYFLSCWEYYVLSYSAACECCTAGNLLLFIVKFWQWF